MANELLSKKELDKRFMKSLLADSEGLKQLKADMSVKHYRPAPKVRKYRPRPK